MFVVAPDGAPKAVPILVGVTDGTYSELRQGENLEPGREVIVGESAAPPPPGTRFPLRF